MSIELKGITKSYGDTSVFDGFSLTLEKGRISCILGRSGSGKTTLLNIIAGTEKYGGEVNRPAGGISYIFQQDMLINSLTAYQNIEYVLLRLIKDKALMRQTVMSILETAEIAHKKDKYPNELSGGMRQRLSMARAFVYPSEIMLMDEPFKSLDISLKARMIDAFLKLWERDRRTVAIVTHDIDEALLIADTVFILKGSPAKIVKTVETDRPHMPRNITDDYFNKIRNDIYKIMTE